MALLELKMMEVPQKCTYLCSVTYVTVIVLGPEHMIKEIIKQSFSPHNPLSQSRGQQNAYRGPLHRSTCELPKAYP